MRYGIMVDHEPRISRELRRAERLERVFWTAVAIVGFFALLSLVRG